MIRALSLAPLAALALFASATPAAANDPRLVERLYDPAEVVRIEGKTKVQATIAFDPDESIENVAIGDSSAWQVTPNKRANLLFVKPLSPTARTNMTVITNRHTYLFDLVASPRAEPLYVLRFTYPEEPEPQEPQIVELPNAVELAAASDPYAVVDPAALNFAWSSDGDRDVLPERAYDDGNATFLTWPSGKPVPAILIKDSKGTEGPVNFSVRGDTIVVDGVPREIVLRSGKNSAILINDGPVRATNSDPQASLARSDVPSDREGK
ncbi:TrbG/VirB9 family P-type conjugative transfer protein [Pontixanthobacter aestiaquae]|uniref:Type VI secretion protein n=1 Tax=Pontixanthobacter aestiaquae TaxID=1509367 RepID=A0A844ZAI4_9SPHN|nr:TrbG/VirB9 family P-type conjugative transfer protein [Pontixanthobacter aestiaquae]MDN3644680.1 TrbG/VirB9 family P-type conjugative transfer protein [Pontixanthobacter aestiaquae]MXO84312.1 type VI secretion protein [Pontixanthobacter aestiaquae]